MAPQTDIPPAANVLSTIGTVFWCVQLIPQIWHNWRSKDTTGLPASMMFLWSACAVPFGAYDIIQNFAIPLIVQPQVFGTLALIVWGQCLFYGHGWSLWRTGVAGVITWVIFGGVEAALIVTLKPVYERGTEWPVLLIGIIASVLLWIGFIPVTIEIIRRRGRVVGIDFIFLLVDWLGAFFSLMGVVTQNSFDVIGGVLYIIWYVSKHSYAIAVETKCISAAIEIGIFASQGIWLLRTRKLRKRAKEMGVDFDDLPEARRYQWPRNAQPEDDAESQRTRRASCTQKDVQSDPECCECHEDTTNGISQEV